MPSTSAILSLVKRKFDEHKIDRSRCTFGDEYEDDYYSLYPDGNDWCVGWNERGKKRALARFNDDVRAAEYLMHVILKGTPQLNFPNIDWTEYASLPD